MNVTVVIFVGFSSPFTNSFSPSPFVFMMYFHSFVKVFFSMFIMARNVLTFYALMDSSFWFGAANLGWPIVYIEGS